MTLLDNTLIITKFAPENGDNIVSAVFDEKQILVDINIESTSILNNIYIGKVKSILNNINAAFIEIANSVMCYYSLNDNKNPIFTSRQSNKKLCIGDELLVQVSKEAAKNKQPVCTSILSFPGKYIVVTSGETKIGISNKLDETNRKRLKEFSEQFINDDYGIIFRTNAKSASYEELKEEILKFEAIFKNIKEKSQFRTCFSLIYEGPKPYITELCGKCGNSLKKITTDIPAIYESLKKYSSENQPEILEKLTLYQDDMLPLYKLYSIESGLKDALKQKVWMKSGAYLIIQPTEALTVIDVNTGKFTEKKKQRETYLKINMEAARETARQLRLRNISGICIIDFIDMEDEEDRRQLMNELEWLVSHDPVSTCVVDMTKLNLVEVTRKRIRKPLYEQAKHMILI